MELLTFALSGLLLGLAWHCMLKKTILDDHRDKLFDLRDELRHTFASNGWSMDDPMYRRLRDLVNGYLRFTENYSFWEFFILERGIQRNPQLRDALNRHFERKFDVAEDRQKKFVTMFRRKAVDVMMSYMILSSGPLVLLLLFFVPVIAVGNGIAMLVALAQAGGRSVAVKAVAISDLVGSLLRLSVSAVARRLLQKEFVEEYSYRQSCVGENELAAVSG